MNYTGKYKYYSENSREREMVVQILLGIGYKSHLYSDEQIFQGCKYAIEFCPEQKMFGTIFPPGNMTYEQVIGLLFPRPIMISNYVVKFDSQGIKMGCTSVSKEIVKKIYDRLQ